MALMSFPEIATAPSSPSRCRPWLTSTGSPPIGSAGDPPPCSPSSSNSSSRHHRRARRPTRPRPRVRLRFAALATARLRRFSAPPVVYGVKGTLRQPPAAAALQLPRWRSLRLNFPDEILALAISPALEAGTGELEVDGGGALLAVSIRKKAIIVGSCVDVLQTGMTIFAAHAHYRERPRHYAQPRDEELLHHQKQQRIGVERGAQTTPMQMKQAAQRQAD